MSDNIRIGGDIKSKIASKNSGSLKQGYTIIELVVVMGIIATLTTLGVGGLMSVRNSTQVDAVAEELVTTIRQAQNNAISINPGTCSSGSTKLWGTVVRGNDFELFNRCYSGINPYTTVSAKLSPYKDVQINLGGATANTQVIFSTPFGRGYLIKPAISPGFKNGGSSVQDYVPSNLSEMAPASQTIIVEKNGYSREVVLSTNGDVYER